MFYTTLGRSSFRVVETFFEGFEDMASAKSNPNDNDIIELFWNRDERAIKMTDMRYGRYINSLQFNILGNKEDVEECRNDTYLQLWRRIPPNRPKTFVAFLSKIAHDIAVSYLRERCAQKRIPSQMMVSLDELQGTITESSQGNEQQNERKENSEIIGKIINEFLKGESLKNRRIFIMRYYYADSVSDIACVMGIGERMVYHALKEMKLRLKKSLAEENIRIQ